MRRRDNRGSTMVMVLVALAVVSVLATIALWVALQNFQMKVTDRKSTDNFYSAEGVLDQICAGLQDDVSDSMKGAYYEVMQNYATMNEADRTTYFTSKYVYNLRNCLKYTGALNPGTAAADYTCSLDHLLDFLGTEQKLHARLIAGDDEAAKYCELKTTKDSVIIKDLKVEYTDTEGYYSVIRTDIQLGIPSLNLTQSESLPNVFSYSIIGNEGVEFSGALGTRVKGNVYSGSPNALDATKTTQADYESLVIENSATVDFAETDYLIVDGDANVSGKPTGDATLSASQGGQFWARNIDILSAWANLYGNTYVADDLKLSGENPGVAFGKDAAGSDPEVKGNYVGYGTSAIDAGNSSSIVINGRNSILDMSKVGSMVVAGHSYISSGKLANVNYDSGKRSDNKDVQMAGSISVKGDQIAYLVPTECVGVVKSTGKSLYDKNPLTVGEYKKIAGNTSKYNVVDTSVSINRTGNTIADYQGAVPDNQIYRMVVVPSKTGNADDGLVYFYLNLDSDNAKLYFKDYFGADNSKLTKYTDFYTNAIKSLSAEASIFTAGLYATYEDDTLTYGQGVDPINGRVGDLPGQYQCLTSRLMVEGVTEEQKQKTVFDNIINVTETEAGKGNGLKTFLAACPGKQFTTSVNLEDSDKAIVVLLDNAGGSAYRFNDADSKNHYLIVATGDVIVQKNFSGTIIANGKVTVTGMANMTLESISTEYMKKLLQVNCTGGTKDIKLYEIFADGNGYISNGFGTTEGIDSDTEVGIGDLISYANWKKE